MAYGPKFPEYMPIGLTSNESLVKFMKAIEYRGGIECDVEFGDRINPLTQEGLPAVFLSSEDVDSHLLNGSPIQAYEIRKIPGGSAEKAFPITDEEIKNDAVKAIASLKRPDANIEPEDSNIMVRTKYVMAFFEIPVSMIYEPILL